MPPPPPSVLQPQRRPNPENKPAAAAAIPHTRRTEVQPKHERPDIRPANVLYSCIDRAKCPSMGKLHSARGAFQIECFGRDSRALVRSRGCIYRKDDRI
jgi:hypothetical protein